MTTELIHSHTRVTDNAAMSPLPQYESVPLESYYKQILCNVSLTDFKGEEWKEIPGFENYQISNFGRVKTLARRVEMPQGRFRMQKDKIMKLFVTRHKNNYLKTEPVHIFCALGKDGVKKRMAPARLVYCLFIEAFDLSDMSKVVSYKDSNGENLHYTNLELLTISEQKYKMFRKKRARSWRSDHRQPIVQYSMDGELIRSYESMYEAEKATGLNSGSIYTAVMGKSFSAGGFRWLPITEAAQTKQTIDPASDKLKIAPALNKKLWQKLGSPPLPDPLSACLDLSIEDLPEEEWKPIVGYETLYEISNQGRVRKLAGWNSAAGRKIWLPSQIMQLKYERGALSVGLTQNQTKRFFSIKRLVYAHFVEMFDITDRHILIVGGNDPLHFSINQLKQLTAKEHKQHLHKTRKSVQNKHH